VGFSSFECSNDVVGAMSSCCSQRHAARSERKGDWTPSIWRLPKIQDFLLARVYLSPSRRSFSTEIYHRFYDILPISIYFLWSNKA
jgi:hypothetical protein